MSVLLIDQPIICFLSSKLGTSNRLRCLTDLLLRLQSSLLNSSDRCITRGNLRGSSSSCLTENLISILRLFWLFVVGSWGGILCTALFLPGIKHVLSWTRLIISTACGGHHRLECCSVRLCKVLIEGRPSLYQYYFVKPCTFYSICVVWSVMLNEWCSKIHFL